MNMEINPSEYKVLIVDDVISNVLLLKVLLTNEKFKIVTAGNGTQALEQVKKENPDLVLLDVMMPDISGFEVAQQMKADPEMAEIPIIFLTALNSTADIVKGFQVGGNDFISKPFNKEELIIRVTHQISLVAAKRIIVAQTEELRKTIMGRDKLYSVIAHDLRSPMGSIKMVLNMLILNLPSETIGDEMYELLTMANQTTEDVFSLLDNLLKWTKSQIGKLKVVYQDINMVEVVEGVSEIFTMVASLKNIKIVQDVPVENVAVRADIDMIKTVIRNLISNAIKFSNEGSEVVVSLAEEDGMAIVSVKDSGCGIDDENQKKLLHTDTHFSTFGTNNEEGSGLGLLLCQDFVVKNGGKLWFTSKKGDGSTFSFSIPLLGSWNYAPSDWCYNSLFADDNTLSRKGDVRLKATFTSQDANRVIKYPNGTYQLAETSDYTCTPVVISRISEMYLIKAEALGKTNGAAALVEYMKKRYTTAPSEAAIKALSDKEYQTLILDERRREFYAEGMRWQDIKRTNRLELLETLDGRTYLMYYPIPQDEIDMAGTVAYPQNPGYAGYTGN